MVRESRKTFSKCIALITAGVLLYGMYNAFVLNSRYLNVNNVLDASNNHTGVDSKHLNRVVVTSLESDNFAIASVPASSIRSLRLKRYVRLVNPSVLWKESKEYACVQLKITNKTPICVHNPEIDRGVSRYILSVGIWEAQTVKEFGEALTRYNVTDVLDVGSNIGLYSLQAAKLNRRVVAIDANIENLKLLSKSLVLGNLTDSVTILWNAVSDVYSNVTLAHVQGSVARAFIRQDGVIEDANLVETLLIDDLRYLFTDEIVAMKMDVELYELLALRGAQSFLKNIKVKFIQIEIQHHRRRDSGRQIVDLLKLHGFTPFKTCSAVDNLTDIPIKEWSPEVCFIR